MKKNKKVFKILTCSFLLLSFVTTISAQTITQEQQKRLEKYFSINKQAWDVSKQILDQVLEEHKDFFSNYADTLTAIDVLTKFANAQDMKALETIVIEVEKKILEKVMPNLAGVLSWASWAKTGMQILIDYVINPALMEKAIDTYYNNREAGIPNNNDPVGSTFNIRAWGNIEQQLLKEFRKQYGDGAFKDTSPSGLVLLPRWREKFDKFVPAWFEMQYQNRKLKEAMGDIKKKLNEKNAEKAAGALQIKRWIDEKKKELEEEIDDLIITPVQKTIKVNETVTFKVMAQKKDKYEDVTETALSSKSFTGTTPGEHEVVATYKGKTAVAVVTVEEEEEPEEEPEEDIDDVIDNIKDEEEDDICSMSYMMGHIDRLNNLISEVRPEKDMFWSYANKFDKELNDRASDPCENSMLAYCYVNAFRAAGRMEPLEQQVNELSTEIIMLQGICPDLSQKMQAEGYTIKSLVSSLIGLFGPYRSKMSEMRARLSEKGCDENEVEQRGEAAAPPDQDPEAMQDGSQMREIPGDAVDNDGDSFQDENLVALAGMSVTFILWDHGPSKDDIFSVKIEGSSRILGTTSKGGRVVRGLVLKPGRYTAIVKIESAPDNIGTFTLVILDKFNKVLRAVSGGPPEGTIIPVEFEVIAQ